MEKLTGYQKKYLRGLAHSFAPHMLIGRKGLSETVLTELDQALEGHELIKIRFIDTKDKAEKIRAVQSISDATHAEFIGMRGHTALFFRRNSDKSKQSIVLPQKRNPDDR